MIFSRVQLDQLAEVNQFSINTLISEQKKLAAHQARKIDFQNKIKQVVSSKSGGLASGSSLLMGRINTSLLTKYGYSDMAQLISDYEENERNIDKISKTVSEQDKKIKDSLKQLSDVDITKDMSTQVTQEVLLDSQLAEVRNNSQEILLMLSQSKTGKDLLHVAQTQVDKNEKAITDYITANKSNTKKITTQTNTAIKNSNNQLNGVNNRINDINEKGNQDTFINRLNKGLSNMSTGQKNGLIGATFVAFFSLGLFSASDGSKGKKTDDEEGSNDG